MYCPVVILLFYYFVFIINIIIIVSFLFCLCVLVHLLCLLFLSYGNPLRLLITFWNYQIYVWDCPALPILFTPFLVRDGFKFWFKIFDLIYLSLAILGLFSYNLWFIQLYYYKLYIVYGMPKKIWFHSFIHSYWWSVPVH